MPLTFQEKVDIRRHLGVPVAGVQQSGNILRVGRLEYLMENLQMEEESVIAGRPYAMFQIFGNPTTGHVITIVVTPVGGTAGTPILYTVSPADAAAYYPRLSVALNAANAIVAAGQGVVAAAGQLYPNQAPSTAPPFSQVTLTSPSMAAFTIEASSNDQNMPVTVWQPGTYPSPSLKYMDDNDVIKYVYGIVPICNMLENMVYGAQDNLDLTGAGSTSTQGGAQFRRDELGQREALYRRSCRQLSRMFGDWSNM